LINERENIWIRQDGCVYIVGSLGTKHVF
jgi:hypothetical protein